MDHRALGIDVSHYNAAVNWNAVAASGISFAFVKATQGCNPDSSGYEDSRFASRWPGMKDAGIIRGAYHFIGLPLTTTPRAKWNDDLHRQIDHFLTILGPLEAGDLPPVLDLEDGDSALRWRNLIATNRSAALGVVRELVMYTNLQLKTVKPILYTGSFWRRELGDPDERGDDMPFSDCPLWFAQYPQVHAPVAVPSKPGANDMGEAANFAEYAARLDGHAPRHIPRVWGGAASPKWAFWQFSEFGALAPAVSGYVDLNVFHGTTDELKGLCIASG